MKRKEKVVSLSEAIQTIPHGASIAIDGDIFHNVPMALIREIIRQKKTGLHVYTCDHASIQADILLGAGSIAKLVSPYVGFEWLGMAPCFRRALENKAATIIQCDELYLDLGLRGAAGNLPFLPVPRGWELTDLPTIEGLYGRVRDTADGSEHLVVRKFKIDVSVLLAQASDPYGNLIYEGSKFRGPQMARAADKVIACVEEIIPHESIRADPRRTTIPGHLVDAVVALPYVAHPCSSHGRYTIDERHLRQYLKMAETPEGFRDYLEEFVFRPTSHDAYLTSVGGIRYLASLRY